MFGQPVPIEEEMSVFHSVWTYAIKALDPCKKACWACDGSPGSEQAKILDETYANCVDQTSLHLFYAISAAESILILGVDVSNAFAEAPLPKKGSTFTQIGLFEKGGSIINSGLQSLKVGSSLSYLLCKVTQNCHGCGRNTRTLFYASVVWCPLYMNHVYIPGGSMASG
jgi:hypothetical protein